MFRFLKICVGLIMLVSMSAVARGELIMRANFSQVSTTPGCEGVFAKKAYDLKLFILGQSGRTLVLHHQDPWEQGFLHRVNLVANYGYENDFMTEKTVVFEGFPYHVKAAGFFTDEVFFATYEVEDEAATCSARAELTGFPGADTSYKR